MIRRTKSRVRLCWLLLCLILAFIWGNSLLPSEVSAALSQWVRRLIFNLSHSGTAPGREEGHHILRKLAHAGEFCCLGACAASLARMLCNKKTQWILLPLLGGVVAACVDETIQCFVPGRGPGLTDVGIDTLGTALGIVIISFILFLNRMRTKKFWRKIKHEKAYFFDPCPGYGRSHGCRLLPCGARRNHRALCCSP